ncbi:MAG: hypothetical protein ACQERD_04065 [Campylobacterota bacterium]
MATQIQANVKSKEDQKGWYIELYDPQSEQIKICENLEDFNSKLTDMAAEYSFDIEVAWKKDSSVTNEQFYELHQQIAQKKQELDI